MICGFNVDICNINLGSVMFECKKNNLFSDFCVILLVFASCFNFLFFFSLFYKKRMK